MSPPPTLLKYLPLLNLTQIRGEGAGARVLFEILGELEMSPFWRLEIAPLILGDDCSKYTSVKVV